MTVVDNQIYMSEIINRLRAKLQEEASEEGRIAAQRFFKEELRNYGIKNPRVAQIAKEFLPEIKKFGKNEVLAMCDVLWQSGYFEESLVSCVWTEKIQPQFEPDDFQLFEKWINQNVNNWASCDTLCNHTVGDFVLKYPEFIGKLKAFALSDNRWVKRAAAVTLIVPARKGFFLNDIFEIAGLLLMDKDDLVQKGYGWMLKAASEAYQHKVFEFVMQNKAKMPRTALRYAIEKMPAELKQQAMAK